MAPPQFVSEAIEPVPGTMSLDAMARGEPGLPQRFRWRGTEHAVERVLDTWKETGPCRSGSPERYVRKHWFRVVTTTGDEMQLYFERQARSGRQRKARWWLYTVCPGH